MKVIWSFRMTRMSKYKAFSRKKYKQENFQKLDLVDCNPNHKLHQKLLTKPKYKSPSSEELDKISSGSAFSNDGK